jgi:hypothetical protein
MALHQTCLIFLAAAAKSAFLGRPRLAGGGAGDSGGAFKWSDSSLSAELSSSDESSTKSPFPLSMLCVDVMLA